MFEDLKYHKMTPEAIVIHCAATKPDQDIGWYEIDRWHRAKGWFSGGYHYVVRRDGTVEKGRPDDKAGAHAKGYNHFTLGVCLVGGIDKDGKPENNFTDAQWLALTKLLVELALKHHSIDAIVGHNELPNVKKACPSFNVKEWLKGLVSLQNLLDSNHKEKYHEED